MHQGPGLKDGVGDDRLKVGPCKILADGSMGGRTPALFAPYNDQLDTDGILLYKEEELRDFVHLVYKHGFQLAIHGIGDRAISKIIDLYEEILLKESQKEGITMEEAARKLRPRIVHGQLTNFKLIERIKELDIGVDIQPIFLNSDLHIAEERLGPDRLKGTYAWKTMMEKGIHLGGGSDGPVDSYKPLDGIYSAVTRKDLNGYPEGGWIPEEILDVEEALQLFTIGSAYNSFDEGKKGTLEVGKLADFVVLAGDPTTVKPDELKDIKVLATYVGGEKVF